MIANYNEDLNDLLLQNQNLIYSLIKSMITILGRIYFKLE